jgi:glycosyltransferase involved in cell wall biosynthesis
MKTIVIFDPAETAGGAFSRAVEVAAELPEFDYLFVTYRQFANLHSGRCPPNFRAVRLFSFLNPTQTNWLHRTIQQNISKKMLANLCALIVNAILKANKISLLIQVFCCLAWRKIDLVQANNGIHFIPYHLAKWKNAKLIYYFRDLQYFAHLPERFLQQAEKLVFVGNKLMEQYQAQLHLTQDRCQVIHSPFDVYARMKYEPAENLDLLRSLKENGRRIIVCASRICAEKGQHVAIDAIRQLSTSWPELTLLIVGKADKNRVDQQYLQHLKQKVSEYQLVDRVVFLGHRKNPLHILQYADIAVQAPTYFEALAGSLVESVQLGIPTISSDIGGASEVLIEGKTGFLFPPGDHNALASIIDRILRNPKEIAPIIAQGKTHALQNWSPIKISAQLRAIYLTAKGTQ